ncbi:GHKL domain-containing protein [Eubacteriaceae bacterium ES3]|nr:GHKL domain-containing protein [Eubacteriaceae bacterium ES3]
MSSDQLNLILGISLSIIPYFVLAFIPVWDQLRYSKRIAVLSGFACIIANVLSVSLIIALFPDWDKLRIGHSLFFLLLYIAVFLFNVRADAAKLIFIALLVKSYADFVVTMAKYLEINFMVLWLEQSFVKASYSFYFNLFQVVMLGLTYPVIWIFFRKKITEVVQTSNKAWNYIWVVPLVYYVISLSFSGLNTELIQTWQFLVFDLAAFFGFYLIYYIVIEMLKQSEKNAILSENNRMMNQQLVLQKNYYQMFGESIDNIRKSEHDMRHHLNEVKALVQKDKHDKAEAYIEKIVDTQPSLKDVMFCKNDTVNALVGYYVELCQREGIELELALSVPESLSIDDVDLCVIFGNLLENAVEASRKVSTGKKRIFMASQIQKNKLLITADNSYEEELKLKNGIYLSSKRKNAHGIGLASISEVAKKHKGQALFKAENQKFQASILLRIEEIGQEE